jgi:thymidylate synthase
LEYTDWILSADVELSQGLLREIKRNDNVAQRYKQFSLRGQRIDEQIDDVVNELYWTPDSRKAQIAILHPEDQEIREESRRSISTQEYPSNIAIGYYLQNSELHTQVITSSLDLRREFPLEGFLQSVLSLEIAERLSVKTGIISWFSLDISISRV